MRIIIVGAGVGGLTLALFLHRRGFRPLILERSSMLEEAGAGVQLGPNATRLLFGLGLEEAVRAVAVEPVAAEVRDGATGALRLRLPLGDRAQARWEAPYLQLHRGDLQALLLNAVQERNAAELRLGVEVEPAAAGALRLSDGTVATPDLIVGCDGLRSRVREGVRPGLPTRPFGEIAWRALIPRADGDPLVAGVWVWRRRHLVTYPVRSGAAVNVVAVTAGALGGDSWSEPGDPAALQAAFADAEPRARAVLARVQTTARWALAERPPLPSWSTAGATLLGDAAHPMLPYLAQGAAMAIEDAEALARHLAEPSPLADRLAAYEAERKPRTTRVQAASRRNGRVFHLPPPLSAAAFAAARALGAGGSLDWLYGYRPSGQ